MSKLTVAQQDSLWTGLKKGHMDLDKMEICLSPDYYLSQFGSPLSIVRLSSHQPWTKRTHSEDIINPFSHWLLLAESSYQLWIDPKYKDNFYKELKKLRTVQPAEDTWVSTYGHAIVPVTVLVHCLKRTKCPTILFKTYGQKLPMCPPFLRTEPSQENHPERHLNQWDIGITFKSPLVYLFKPKLGKSSKVSSYPMGVPGSLDYGSVLSFIKYMDTSYKIKIYPRLVHVIKSFNSRLQGEKLSSIRTVRRRTRACVQMVKHLSDIPDKDFGGFRIEVSVQAPTLSIARTWVERTPFLDIKFWTCPMPSWAEGHQMDTLVCTKKDILQNANWTIQKATSLKILEGRDSNVATRLQKRVVADILCSLGWNAGRQRTTMSLDKKAWWTGHFQKTPQVQNGHSETDVQIGQVLTFLYDNFKDIDGQKTLLSILRNGHSLGYVPCQMDTSDHYNIDGWSPLRLRCNNKTCKHNLNAGNSFRYFANLIVQGHVSKELVGMSALNMDTSVSELVKIFMTFLSLPLYFCYLE